MFEPSRQGAVDVIAGDEAINADHVEHLEPLLQAGMKRGQPRVVLHLGEVPLVDSRGLELLLDYRDRYAQGGGALKLVAPSPLVRDILHITGLEGEFEIFTDVVSAVGSFAQ